MTIIVTGSAGRIGRVVVQDFLNRGEKVLGTDVTAGDTVDVVGDLTDREFIATLVTQGSALVHLAGHPNSRDFQVLERVNSGATRDLIEAAGAAGVRRFVYASSVHVCGLAAADAHLSGNMPTSADSPYGVSKVTGEALLSYGWARYGMSAVALRICAFRPRPGNARELRLWLSPRDMARLAHASVHAEFPGVETIWGVSANRRADVDRVAWDRIGYRPVDEAEDYLSDLAASGIDVGVVSEWPLLGGAVAEASIGLRSAINSAD